MLAPSYWDEVTRRLMQTAMQAAAGGNQRVAAIANGSQAVDSAAELYSTLCSSHQAALEQSLVVRSVRCCAHSVQHERTASSEALAAVLRHAARSNRLQRGWAGLPDAADVRSMKIMIIGQSWVSKSPLLRAFMVAGLWPNQQPAIDAVRDVRVIGDDDTETQAQRQHGRQLGCCRVV